MSPRPDSLKTLFPLFATTEATTLSNLLSAATELSYPAGRTVLMEDSWGNAVYLILSGWIKVRHDTSNSYDTLAVLGKGDFFGEMAILDESPRSTDVVALSAVNLITIPAQHFIDILFQDSLLHHRMLQMMVQRLRHTNSRLEIRHKPPAVKLAHTLTSLAQAYGQRRGETIEILNLPTEDLAAVADISKEEVTKIMDKLTEKGWIAVQENTLTVKSVDSLIQLANK